MRRIAILATMLLAGGCSGGVEGVWNPRTGEFESCSQGLADWSPWSQRDACIAGHVAQGWNVKVRGQN
jgi:hypothetical protein